MSKLIDLSRGYDSLSEQDKLYLAARGKLPKEYITDGIRSALNISGVTSNVAYGAHTGTTATLTDEELEAELARRRASADPEKAFEKGEGNAKNALMPDLDNPHSERLDSIKENYEQSQSEAAARHAASQTAAAGPSVPSLGAPGVTQRTEVGQVTTPASTDDDEDDDTLSPEDYADEDTETTNKQLRAEILRRNEERDEAGLEPLSIEGKKADLVRALQQDDEERADEDDDGE